MKRFLIIFLLLLPSIAFAELQMHVIDVGQGDSIAITCNGEAMLIDAGDIVAGQVVHNYLTDQLQLTQLKAVIATHSHDDHCAGFPEALESMQVETFYLSDTISPLWWSRNVLPGMSQTSCEIIIPEMGSNFMLGDASVTFLCLKESERSINDRSIAVRIEENSHSFLLMADIEGDAEVALIQSGIDLKADVLKLGHHGSDMSACDAFLNVVCPTTAVISVGLGNAFGHPWGETLERLHKHHISDIYRTDLHGNIVFIADQNGISTYVTKNGLTN